MRTGPSRAMAEVGRGEWSPIPRRRHQKTLSVARHHRAIVLMQVEYVLAFEVSKSLLSPMVVLTLCCLHVAHECGEGFDPGIMAIPCLVVVVAI